jgi:hypothetical protein
MNSYSFFIPRMSTRFTKEQVGKVFEDLEFGKISRIDFTPINKKPGFGENVDRVVKSAFIHFSELYETGRVVHYWNQEGIPHKFNPFENSHEYWLILPAKNPIPDTMMNRAQIVENCRLLEKKVEEQEEKIKKLEAKLEGVHTVVYQLLGGLFNQREQGYILDKHLAYLFSETLPQSLMETSKWGIWPTTRQGDENERRIERLEAALMPQLATFDLSDEDEEVEDLALFERKREQCDNEQDGQGESDSVSSHSSMPDLISCSSSSSHSSYAERRRISDELCGNQ